MGLKHQAVSARKWRVAIRRVQRHFPAHLPPLLFLTDPQRTPDPISIAKRLPRGTGIIYRHFGAPDRYQVANALAKTCADQKLILLVAADPDLARAVGAQGVHWPEARLLEATKWRGRFTIQTASAHSRQALARTARLGMDAALVSTVFTSNSPSAGVPIGPLKFRTRTRHTRVPVYALGGVRSDLAAQIADTSGIAAIEGLS